MKKKIAVILMVVIMVVLCLMLVACNLGNNKSDNSSKPKATLTSVTVTIAEGSRYAEYFSDGEVNLPTGTAIAFEKTDFVVTGQYSDGTKKMIMDYTFQSNQQTATKVVLQFFVKDALMAQMNVNTIARVLPTFEKNNLNFSYTGQPIDVFEEITLSDGAKLSDLVAAGVVTMSDTSNRTETNVGMYNVILTATEGFVWVNDNNQKTSYANFAWRITQKVIPLPTVSGSSTFAYDGTEKTLELDMHGYEEVLDFVSGGRDSRKATDAGSYVCYVKINEANKSNYTFENNTQTMGFGIEVARWTISKKALPVPTIANMTPDASGYYHYAYTGAAILPDLVVGQTALTRATDGAVRYTDTDLYPTSGVTITLSSSEAEMIDALSGNHSATDGTRYRVIEASIDMNAERNYCWEGTTERTIQIKYIVDRAEASLPADFAENFKLKYVYTGEEDEIANKALIISDNSYLALLGAVGEYTLDPSNSFENGFMMTEEVKEYLVTNNILVDDGANYEFVWGQNATFGSGNIASIGTIHLDLIYKKGVTTSFGWENYEPLTVSVEVEVIKGFKELKIEDFNVKRSDQQAMLIYSLDTDGNVMNFVVSFSANLSYTVQNYFSRTEDDQYVGVAAADLNQAGYYKTVITATGYDDTLFNVYIRKEANKYVVTDSYTKTWSVAKRDFSYNGSGAIYDDSTQGTVSYHAGGSYRDFFPANGYVGNDITVNFTYEIKVYYRVDSTHDYELLVKDGNGKYNLAVEGQYKAVVTIDYDKDNLTTTSDQIEKEWDYID